MTRAEIFDLLLRCNNPQLDAITEKLDLPAAFLPGANQAPAVRASEIIKLVVQLEKLPELESVLLTFFPPKPGKGAKVILILSANPLETDPLQIEQEVRLIKDRLQESDAGRKYRVESERAVKATDLSKFLLEHQPAVVHFSGHGSPTGDIVLEDDNGDAAKVPVNLLASLFDILKSPTECVVLNACYSREHASAVARFASCVVGMDKAIGDSSALRFAGGFYRGLAFGRDFHTSFRLGCNEIDLAALPDAAVPHFTTREKDQVAESTTQAGTPAIAIKSPARTWVERDAPITAEQPGSPKLYPLWFGTNRRPVDSANPSKGFSSERDPDMHFGLCTVAVPKSHKFGSVGSSWWKRLMTLKDDRLKLKDISILEEAAFWISAKKALSEWDSGERMALVFIHGFNVTFEESAIRTAQMAVDLKIPGVAAFFSWPSKGRLSVFDYTADEASIEGSEEQISDFLINFAQKTDADRIDVVAHSMGNRGLLRAMQRIVNTASAVAKKPFRNIVFAAPDVDSVLFRQLAAAHAQLAEHTTLYLSSRDRALASSGLIHDAPRAGFVPPVTLVNGIDVIEVANADLTLLGHGYYGAAEGVLYDMRELLIHDTAPKSRARLTEAKADSGAGIYWRIGA
jgi:esterase/lipase superfamily enzyme